MMDEKALAGHMQYWGGGRWRGVCMFQPRDMLAPEAQLRDVPDRHVCYTTTGKTPQGSEVK